MAKHDRPAIPEEAPLTVAEAREFFAMSKAFLEDPCCDNHAMLMCMIEENTALMIEVIAQSN